MTNHPGIGGGNYSGQTAAAVPSINVLFTELLRLHSTIQAQVEGELRFRLSGGNFVPTSRRHTQTLKDDILLAG